jgi:HEAT repeat protein
MSRTLPLLLLALALALTATPAWADGDGDAAAEAAGEVALPPLSSEEEVEAAIDTFKEEWKARGLRGDDRLSQRDYAMSRLASVQHPDVVDELFRVTRNRDPILRTLAVIYLGEQRALPAYAGERVVRALKRNDDDEVFVMSALQSIGNLRYLGGREVIADMLQHQDYAIKKAAIAAVGATGDLRLLKDILKILGINWTPGQDGSDTSASGGSQEEVVEEGYSWEGVDVTYDTGTAGTHDQEMAEKIGKEQLAANRAAAEAAARGGSGVGAGGGDTGVSSGGRGGASRTTEELMPAILRTLHQLTGEKFDGPGTLYAWVRANDRALERNMRALDEQEREQEADPKREDE